MKDDDRKPPRPKKQDVAAPLCRMGCGTHTRNGQKICTNCLDKNSGARPPHRRPPG